MKGCNTMYRVVKAGCILELPWIQHSWLQKNGGNAWNSEGWLENDEKEPVYPTEGFVHYPTDNTFPRKKNHGEICVLEKKKNQSKCRK